MFVSDGTFTETVFIPGVGNVVRQVIAFHVRSELFLTSGVTYAVQVHDQQNGQTVLLNPGSGGRECLQVLQAEPGAGLARVPRTAPIEQPFRCTRGDHLRDPVMSDLNDGSIDLPEQNEDDHSAGSADKGVPGAGESACW